MLVYKITHKNYASSLSSSGADGRWASDGRVVIYCADSIPLAFLENMVRRQGAGFNRDYKTVIVDIPDTLKIQTVSVTDLEVGWRNFRIYTECQQIGNLWYDGLKRPLLKVPSAVLPESNNFILNTRHPGFQKIKIVAVTELVPAERIEDILKNYKKP